jgi:GT2 family glycosyltransferase
VSASVLIVIPTLGQRLEFLEQTLVSIRSQDTPADVVVVTPASATAARELAAGFGAVLVDDPGSQTAAVNRGVASAATGHEFVNWIGDDDILAPGSLTSTVEALRADDRRVVAYGACSYIDDQGRLLWTSQAGRWAQRILPWGPDLIPQPGMLVRRSAWDEVGGVDETLRFAFDLDLLLKLRDLGEFVDVGLVVSSFRWHPDSLTVSDRTASLDESEAVKRRHLSPRARKMSWLWEKPVRGATRLAAREVTRRAHKAQARP